MSKAHSTAEKVSDSCSKKHRKAFLLQRQSRREGVTLGDVFVRATSGRAGRWWAAATRRFGLANGADMWIYDLPERTAGTRSGQAPPAAAFTGRSLPCLGSPHVFFASAVLAMGDEGLWSYFSVRRTALTFDARCEINQNWKIGKAVKCLLVCVIYTWHAKAAPTRNRRGHQGPKNKTILS